MKIMEDLVLNLILVMFPILIYFIYICYQELRCCKYNHLLLDVTLVTGMYLVFKFGTIEDNILGLLFCNLPIIVSYLKRHSSTAVLLSLMAVSYAYGAFSLDIRGMSIKFIIYFIIYVIYQKDKLKDNFFIGATLLVQGLFLVCEYWPIFTKGGFLEIMEIIVVMFIFYVLPFGLLYLFHLADTITSLYRVVSDMEKEKQVRNSLFKITHEVKNPIAVCKGYLDMLDVRNEKQVERYIPIIKQEVGRSLDIMNDFMEFSKIKIEKEILDINMLLEDVGEEMKILVSGKDIEFKCKLIQDEVLVEGDYNRLKQVFINIIKNSLESISGKGYIEVVTHLMRDYYYIEIIDNGCGMDEETLARVYEMFFTTKDKGSGLGVSLSNEIIKAHNGSVKYLSKVGKGTKVIVKLPTIVI